MLENFNDKVVVARTPYYIPTELEDTLYFTQFNSIREKHAGNGIQLAYLAVAAAHFSLALGGCGSVPREARDHPNAGAGGRGYARACLCVFCSGCRPASQ